MRPANCRARMDVSDWRDEIIAVARCEATHCGGQRGPLPKEKHKTKLKAEERQDMNGYGCRAAPHVQNHDFFSLFVISEVFRNRVY